MSETNGGKAAERGEGRCYRRNVTWWCAYYGPSSDGGSREYRESSHSTNERDAWRLLRERQREVGNHRKDGTAFQGPDAARVIIGGLLTTLFDDYQHGERPIKSLRQQRGHLKPVREFFGHRRALSLTPDRVREYIAERRAAGRATATIDRELAILKRAYSLPVKERRLAAKPVIPSAGPEDNVRRGYLGPADVARIAEHLDPVMRAITYLRFGRAGAHRKYACWRGNALIEQRGNCACTRRKATISAFSRWMRNYARSSRLHGRHGSTRAATGRPP